MLCGSTCKKKFADNLRMQFSCKWTQRMLLPMTLFMLATNPACAWSTRPKDNLTQAVQDYKKPLPSVHIPTDKGDVSEVANMSHMFHVKQEFKGRMGNVDALQALTLQPRRLQVSACGLRYIKFISGPQCNNRRFSGFYVKDASGKVLENGCEHTTALHNGNRGPPWSNPACKTVGTSCTDWKFTLGGNFHREDYNWINNYEMATNKAGDGAGGWNGVCGGVAMYSQGSYQIEFPSIQYISAYAADGITTGENLYVDTWTVKGSLDGTTWFVLDDQPSGVDGMSPQNTFTGWLPINPVTGCEVPAPEPVTSSTSTTVSRTFTSSTTTATRTATTTTMGANCTATHMTCPVPSVASGTYQLLGSEDKTECLMQSSKGESFFHFAFGACNSTRVVRAASNLVEEIITLMYRPPSFGSLLVGVGRGGADWPAMVECTCTAPMTALVGSGPMETAPDKKAEGQKNIVGNSEFGVSFGMYRTNSFNNELIMGSVLPDSQRLNFKVTSDSPTDVIGLVNCTAAPTSSIDDPYAVRFVSASCPVGPLEYRVHHSTETHAIRSSLLNFKFAGSTDLFMWCSVIRCPETPCGKCASSQGRRLGIGTPVARQLQGQGTSVQAWFQTQFSTAAVILPGPLLSQSSGLVMWEPVAVPLLGSSDVRSNLTLLGFAANATSLESLASTVTTSLSTFFLRKVQVLRILAAVLPRTRLLSDGLEAGRLGMEATIVENAISAVSQEDQALVLSKLTSLSLGGEVTAKFTHSLRKEMLSQGLDTPAHLQVVVVRPLAALPTATPRSGQEHEGDGVSGSLPMTSSIVLICVSCLVTSSVCALWACLWWQNKRRRRLCPESTWQAKVAGKQDASGSCPAFDTTQDVSGKTGEANQRSGISDLPANV